MAELSYPSPTHNARAVTEAEYEQTVVGAGSGLYATPLSNPVVVAGPGLNVTIKAGFRASVRGFTWESGTVDFTKAIAPNASSSSRSDWVVLRLDRTTWNVTVVILQGTPGSGTPGYTQQTGTTGVYEMPLATATIAPGGSTVSVGVRSVNVGSVIRPIRSDRDPGGQALGEVRFRTDSGAWEGWNGDAWQTMYYDSGRLPLDAGYSSWQPAQSCWGRRVGNMVTCRIWYKRTESTFGRSDSNGSHVATLPSALIPVWSHSFACKFGSASGANARLEVRAASGEIWVIDQDADVLEGRQLFQTINFPID